MVGLNKIERHRTVESFTELKITHPLDLFDKLLIVLVSSATLLVFWSTKEPYSDTMSSAAYRLSNFRLFAVAWKLLWCEDE